MNSDSNEYVEVIGQCKYRSSSKSIQKALSLKELDRICGTIQLQPSGDQCLGVVITNVSLSSPALSHFQKYKSNPLLLIRMAIDDDVLLSMFGCDSDNMEPDAFEWNKQCEKSISDNECIDQILINSSTRTLLPNASVSRILLPDNRAKYLFSC